jgi:hypothetical protein
VASERYNVPGDGSTLLCQPRGWQAVGFSAVNPTGSVLLLSDGGTADPSAHIPPGTWRQGSFVQRKGVIVRLLGASDGDATVTLFDTPQPDAMGNAPTVSSSAAALSFVTGGGSATTGPPSPEERFSDTLSLTHGAGTFAIQNVRFSIGDTGGGPYTYLATLADPLGGVIASATGGTASGDQVVTLTPPVHVTLAADGALTVTIENGAHTNFPAGSLRYIVTATAVQVS